MWFLSVSVGSIVQSSRKFSLQHTSRIGNILQEDSLSYPNSPVAINCSAGTNCSPRINPNVILSKNRSKLIHNPWSIYCGFILEIEVLFCRVNNQGCI